MSQAETLPPPAGAIASRKDQHLDLCATGPVEPVSARTLLDAVALVHCALPELDAGEVELATPFLGRRLRSPIVVTGMTGGTARAGHVNRLLAELAQEHRIALGLGSQRAMLVDPACTPTYDVRAVAPDAVLIGNLGLVQAAAMEVDAIRTLVDDLDLDALAIHLNPAQELAQPEGDRDFRRGYETIERLARGLERPLVVKETGCGIQPAIARRLVDLGVRCVDVSGSGGTSWVAIEALRASAADAAASQTFAGWGVPTAAAIPGARAALGDAATLIASGGLRDGLDMAKALALGADLAGFALPVFRALERGGREAASALLSRTTDELTRALLLTGSRTVAQLRGQPRVIGAELRAWMEAL